jgi:acetylglutamate synthase
LQSDYIVADLTNNDVGVAYELGISWAVNYIRKILKDNNMTSAIELLDKKNIVNKNVIGVASDIRIKTAHKYQGINIPYGLNQYVVGGVLDQGVIVHSFDEVLKLIK